MGNDRPVRGSEDEVKRVGEVDTGVGVDTEANRNVAEVVAPVQTGVKRVLVGIAKYEFLGTPGLR